MEQNGIIYLFCGCSMNYSCKCFCNIVCSVSLCYIIMGLRRPLVVMKRNPSTGEGHWVKSCGHL